MIDAPPHSAAHKYGEFRVRVLRFLRLQSDNSKQAHSFLQVSGWDDLDSIVTVNADIMMDNEGIRDCQKPSREVGKNFRRRSLIRNKRYLFSTQCHG